MQILYLSIIIITILLIWDFKKGVLIYAPMKLFFNMNVRLSSLITFDLAVNILILILFIIKRKKLINERFPFGKAFLIYGVGYTLTCLFPTPVFNFIPRIVISVLLFSYVYYYCLDGYKNIKVAIYSYAIFSIILCGNGLLQPLLGINPLDDYIQSVSFEDLSIFSTNDLVRMGQERYRSFIPHSISYGVACCVIFYLIFWAFNSKIIKGKIIMAFSIMLLLSGIVMCGSRSPILGLVPLVYLFFVPGVFTKNMKKYIIIVLIIFLFVSGDYLVYSIQSIFDPQVAAKAEGSDISLRIRQLAISLDFFMQKPIFGHAINFDFFKYNSDILGAESVWFPLLIKGGLVGTISYALIYYFFYKIFIKTSGKVFLLVFTLGWLIMRSATSLIGVTDVQFFTIIFIIYKYYKIRIYENLNHNTRLQCRKIH